MHCKVALGFVQCILYSIFWIEVCTAIVVLPYILLCMLNLYCIVPANPSNLLYESDLHAILCNI